MGRGRGRGEAERERWPGSFIFLCYKYLLSIYYAPGPVFPGGRPQSRIKTLWVVGTHSTDWLRRKKKCIGFLNGLRSGGGWLQACLDPGLEQSRPALGPAAVCRPSSFLFQRLVHVRWLRLQTGSSDTGRQLSNLTGAKRPVCAPFSQSPRANSDCTNLRHVPISEPITKSREWTSLIGCYGVTCSPLEVAESVLAERLKCGGRRGDRFLKKSEKNVGEQMLSRCRQS